jgi:hypothetical protein
LSTPGNTRLPFLHEESVTKTASYSVAVSESDGSFKALSWTPIRSTWIFVFGETFSSSGLTVTAYYSDSTSEEVEDYYVAEHRHALDRYQEVTVSYLGKTASYNVTLTNQERSLVLVTNQRRALYIGDGCRKRHCWLVRIWNRHLC